MLILAVSAALVAGSALLLASRLAEESVTQWLVAAYVIAFAEIVVVSLLLSLPDELTRWNLLVSVGGRASSSFGPCNGAGCRPSQRRSLPRP